MTSWIGRPRTARPSRVWACSPKFQQTPGQVWRPMPKQGGDTADVLTKLGYTADQIAALNESGVVKVAE